MNKELTIKYFLYSHYLKNDFLSQLRPKGRNRGFFVKDKCFRDYICLTKKVFMTKKVLLSFMIVCTSLVSR